MKSKLETTPLEKALKALRKSISAAKDSDNFVRDSAIKRFEFTYGLCIKFIQKQLENMAVAEDEVDLMSFNDLVRTAAEKGLIDDPVKWFEYRKKRNITSHTYEEDKAEEVYSILNDFVTSVEYLLGNIKRLNS